MKELRTFEHFPEQITCPVCGTNEDAECVLCIIDGTNQDGISEAQPVHLRCAVADSYIPGMGLLYSRIKSSAQSQAPRTEESDRAGNVG